MVINISRVKFKVSLKKFLFLPLISTLCGCMVFPTDYERKKYLTFVLQAYLCFVPKNISIILAYLLKPHRCPHAGSEVVARTEP